MSWQKERQYSIGKLRECRKEKYGKEIFKREKIGSEKKILEIMCKEGDDRLLLVISKLGIYIFKS